ncbi:hypothetical protein QLQ12_32665 [Actinoplanes sp. NEAU-A12]|uniref:Uncharacterized protein n=1 Tax=Actinoplanes sandaracinus TaxID=3045177 RepID=A0ABT6WUE5_9ACTN|nr:hypothetical protein [Actinoplanes sandaracinus]MDI6103373.1 hypothetical protein [Actinoplanes sandaracinus]
MLRPLAVGDTPIPLVQGDTSLLHRLRNAGRATGALCAGFTASAVLLFAVAGLAGRSFGIDFVPMRIRLVVALLICVALVALDVVALRRHDMCSITRRRQTPKNLVFKYGDTRGALIWGLDTGLAVTTFRVSSATWGLIGLGLLNVAPWWQGIGYAAGFCLPIAAAILLVPRRPDQPDGNSREPGWISLIMIRFRRLVQVCALAVSLIAGVTVSLSVLS